MCTVGVVTDWYFSTAVGSVLASRCWNNIISWLVTNVTISQRDMFHKTNT